MGKNTVPPSLIYPESLRAPALLPDAEGVIRTGLPFSEVEFTTIRMAMGLHTASRQPKLAWSGWRYIATAISIGREHAKRASDGRTDTPHYRRVMGEFLKVTGFAFLNKADRTVAVQLLPYWDQIDEWRLSLPQERQAALNNPRIVWDAYNEYRRNSNGTIRVRPSERKRREFPTMLEQLEALAQQLDVAEEQVAYYCAMMQAIKQEAGMNDDDLARIRAKVRADREGTEGYDDVCLS